MWGVLAGQSLNYVISGRWSGNQLPLKVATRCKDRVFYMSPDIGVNIAPPEDECLPLHMWPYVQSARVTFCTGWDRSSRYMLHMPLSWLVATGGGVYGLTHRLAH